MKLSPTLLFGLGAVAFLALRRSDPVAPASKKDWDTFLLQAAPGNGFPAKPGDLVTLQAKVISYQGAWSIVPLRIRVENVNGNFYSGIPQVEDNYDKYPALALLSDQRLPVLNFEQKNIFHVTEPFRFKK